MEEHQYKEGELEQLHSVLYELLAEIIRVCDALKIPYFIQGGTAIGAFFEQSILPWDDDIDIGLTRENYNRFLREAPALLQPQYFLQSPDTEPNTPFYFAKLRKRGTLFVEGYFRQQKMHHGIYIDIFPFDRVPDNERLQKIHRSYCNAINAAFMGKSVWQWKWIRRPTVPNPRPRAFLPCLITWIVDVIFPKSWIYRHLAWAQGLFNGCKSTTYYNMVLMPRDHISVASIENSQQVPFGPLTVTAPSDLETYLRHHYRNLRRHIPKEEQINHRPSFLEFSVEEPDNRK